MTRKIGDKNKPKTTTELIELLNKQLAPEGKKISIIDGEGKIATHEAKEMSNIFELIDEADSYKCGACGSELNEEIAICPKCGANLKWE